MTRRLTNCPTLFSSVPRSGLVALLLGMGMLLSVDALAELAASPKVVTVPASKVAVTAVKAKAVTIELKQFKVVTDAKGVESLVDATAVKPGDVLEYSATYKNTSAQAVGGLVADLPLAEGLEYVANSAKPSGTIVKAAAKDGVFAAEPLTRKVLNKAPVTVPYSEYRALRWTLGQLSEHSEIVVTARVRVEVTAPPAPKTAPGSPQSPPVTPVSAVR